MLEIKNLRKTYNGRPALENVHLTLGPGEIIGLFGGNGAGKTTLMKCILKLLRYEGGIYLDGEEIGPKNIARISFATSEHSFFPALNAREHRDFYALHFPKWNDKRFHALMDFFSLPYDRALRAMSTGQKNQFEVILALCQGADYILMDEPFAGNDIFNREDFYKVLLGILEPNETILLSTHLIEEVEHFVTRAVILKDRTVAADVTTDELDEQNLSLTDYIKQTYAYRSDRVLDALEKLDRKE
ncbi:MAG: ABC transporter ATP-binding protein [Clostridia bacterium]|nr:ABC transporter ATP-binding protein [Clostridia bacterium]MBQ3091364.1 ABC transporter ATP-binding protein [Clostridia bacterium]MBQ9925858.1 ABC transporter ATP-binding protein [Clostridia bacterium]